MTLLAPKKTASSERKEANAAKSRVAMVRANARSVAITWSRNSVLSGAGAVPAHPVSIATPSASAARTLLGNAGPPQVSAPSWGGRRDAAASGGTLLQLDLAIEVHVDGEARNLERHLRRKGFGAGDALCGERGGDRLLDLALRVDADHLEELANAHVEVVFVHGALRCGEVERRRVMP